MKKFKEQMNKPITWGGFIKFNVICGIISWIYAMILWYKMGLLEYFGIGQKFKKKVDNAKEKVGTTYFRRDDDFDNDELESLLEE